MTKEIKYKVVDWWNTDNRDISAVFPSLPEGYKFVASDNPDIVIFGPYGTQHLQFNDAIRIFYTAENLRPDFNECDYAIGFDRMIFGDRYSRLNLSVTKPTLEAGRDYVHRKFCNFIYSNATAGQGAKLRQDFFRELSKYKHIDSPGRVLNNMKDAISARYGENWISGKLEFLRDYKFTIAFENNIYPGYITEKLLHPFLATSIPIYLGDPDVLNDFNIKAFVNIASFQNWKDAIEYIEYLDSDDDAYIHMLSESAMNPNYKQPDIKSFLKNILDNGKIYRKSTERSIFPAAQVQYDKLINRIWNDFITPLCSCSSAQLPAVDSFTHTNWSILDNMYNTHLLPVAREIQTIMQMNVLISQYLAAFDSSGRDPEQINKVLASAAERITGSVEKTSPVKWLNHKNLEQKYRELFALLRPHDVAGRAKVRIGGDRDGGYVQLDQGRDGVAISLGVSSYSPWDLETAQNGWQVWQFDGTIQAPPRRHRNMRFFPKNVVSSPGHKDNETTIAEILAMMPDENDIVLQMDIEGGEWDIFETLSENDLRRFSQIITEFHGLTNGNALDRYKQVFTKLCQSHIPVHFHYNNNSTIFGFRDFLMSSLWEISFVRRDGQQFTPSESEYPTALDRPNVRQFPDVYIGKFSKLI